jgi:ribosomal protein S25
MTNNDKEYIFDRLKDHWHLATKNGIKEEQILGIFAYGSMNYGFFNRDKSDVDSKIILISTFEDFCLKKEWYSKEFQTEENEHIEVKDIRLMREMWQKQNINFIEILFTEYFILNPKYEQLFNHYFKDNRENIAHYDREKTIKSICGQTIHTLKQDRENNKKLYNGYRLQFFLHNYLLGLPYEECLKPKGILFNELMNIKYHYNWDAEVKVKKSMELEKDIQYLLEANKNLDSPCHEAAAAALDTGVCEILKLSFDNKNYSKDNFLKNLTNTETKALYSIFKEIHEEGNISLSKMVDKYSISRPVYNNLLSKLKEFNIAEVVSQGMKGTYIKFIQSEIKAMSIDFK